MTEEQVTKAILSSLIESEWTIVAFDYPQSGSGRMLHADGNASEKNKDGIIPDIVAVKDGICLFFENKDRVVLSDFRKMSALIQDNQYVGSIATLLDSYNVQNIYYGLGLPSSKWNKNAESNAFLVDFIIGVAANKSIDFIYNVHGLAL